MPQYETLHPYPSPNIILLNPQAKNLNSLEILKQLPDMYYSLREINIKPDLARGSSNIELINYFNVGDLGEKIPLRKQIRYEFSINQPFDDLMQDLIKYYELHYPEAEINLKHKELLTFAGKFDADQYSTTSSPRIVDSVSGEHFFPQNDDEYIPESASTMIILFCLRMLSTYYPDIWMKTIDTNIAVSELTDSLLNSVYRKFPNLILDQMTSVKHFIHL